MKILRKTFAVVSVLAIIAGCVGCKKKPSDDTNPRLLPLERIRTIPPWLITPLRQVRFRAILRLLRQALLQVRI